MEQRLNYAKAAPGGIKAMLDLEKYVHGSGLDHGLLHLVKMRASQINGCAYCLDMHSKDARAGARPSSGSTPCRRWREAPFYTARERAALAWTEALTRSPTPTRPTTSTTLVKPQFTEKELADLTFAVMSINAWNRIAIAFRSPAGSYQVPKAKATSAAE